MFQAGYKEVKMDVRMIFWEKVVTDMTNCGTSDDMIELCIEKWTSFSAFTDAFKFCFLTSTRFLCHVAKTILKTIMRELKKVACFGWEPVLPLSSPQASPSVSDAPKSAKVRRHATDEHKNLYNVYEDNRKGR